jgi:hypothetical protein
MSMETWALLLSANRVLLDMLLVPNNLLVLHAHQGRTLPRAACPFVPNAQRGQFMVIWEHHPNVNHVHQGLLHRPPQCRPAPRV